MRWPCAAGVSKARVVGQDWLHDSPNRCGSHVEGARREDEASVGKFPNGVLADVFASVAKDGLSKEAGGGNIEYGEGFDAGCVLDDSHATEPCGMGFGWLE